MSRADEVIERLQAEIVKRDARIVELETAVANRDRAVSGMNEAHWLVVQKLAALKANPSAGVVLPTVEQITEALDDVTCFHDLSAELIAPALLENLRAMIGSTPAVSGVVLPERANVCYGTALDTQLAEAYNEALDEVASLNPCRAQAVPGVLFDGFAVYRALDAKAQGRTSPENVSDTLDAAVRLIRAAAPSAKKESE